MTLEAPLVAVQPNMAGKSKRLYKGVIITGAIASLVSVGLFYMENGYLFPRHEVSTVAYSVGRIDGSVLYTYNAGKKQLELFQLPNEVGTKLPVIDIVKNADNTSYYILLEKEDTPVSNVFYKTTDGSVVKLTTSDSFKAHLTVDQASGQLAYQSAHVDSVLSFRERTQWDLVLLTLNNKAEKIIGAGESPVLLPGGTSVLFSSEQGLRRLTLQSNTVSPVLLTIPKKQLYSISPTTGDIVVFNETAKTLDFYSISKTGSPDYVKSAPVTEIPSLIEYVGTDLFTVVSSFNKQENKTYRITSQKDGKTITVQGTNASSEILQITNL
jgi:hypothetical protein